MKKGDWLVYLCILIFGGLGIYLTFISGNMDKFDSQTKAYRIDPNRSYNSDNEYVYYPIYHFTVDGRDYECKTKGGSSVSPKESKNTVYYDSGNPNNCRTEYEKSTNRIAGIVCLVATAIIVFFFVIKKPSNIEEYHEPEIDMEKQYQMEENAQKVLGIVNKVQLIYKRVILGIIIVILLVFILIDTAIVKQTIKAKDYIDVTATYVDKKSDEESTVFDDYIYTFKDKNGKDQEIVVGVSKNEEPKEEIKIKYDENNPQDYYEEGQTFDKSGIIWYIVKIVALILLILLFFNKKKKNKIHLSIG